MADNIAPAGAQDFRLSGLAPAHSQVTLGVELADVVPDRMLYLESVHWQAGGPLVLLYQVTPGITEQQLRTQGGSQLHWRGELADDRGTDYREALSSGGIQPAADTSIGDRHCSQPPPPDAQFLAITIATPSWPAHRHGEERATIFVPLTRDGRHHALAFTAAVTAWRRKRDRGCRDLLQHYATNPDQPSASATRAEIAAWTLRLRRQGLVHPAEPILTPLGWQTLNTYPPEGDRL